MNKNTMIVIVVIALTVVAVAYFNSERDTTNPVTEFGHEIGHELDEMGDNMKKKSN